MDPQLDANVLIQLFKGVPEFVAYGQVNQGSGLTYNSATRAEFLAFGPDAATHLTQLEQQYGVREIQDVSLTEIQAAAARLQSAFQHDPLGRILRDGDARVAASAFLKNERLATGDLQFFKRARDLGLDVEFVGTSRAAARAAVYQPQPVVVT